jgi:predicted membrane-bound mannosyltransferase
MDNIFNGKVGAIMAILAVALFLGAFYFDTFIRNTVWTILFAILGGLHFWNYKLTWRRKYLAASAIFWLATIVSIANAFLEIISWKTIWITTIVLYVLSRPLAALFRRFRRQRY